MEKDLRFSDLAIRLERILEKHTPTQPSPPVTHYKEIKEPYKLWKQQKQLSCNSEYFTEIHMSKAKVTPVNTKVQCLCVAETHSLFVPCKKTIQEIKMLTGSFWFLSLNYC